MDTLNLLRELGFVINPEKSIVIPSQKIVYLGFVISSKKMILTKRKDEKEIKIKALVMHCLNNNVMM